jgi:hypothetical protein
MQYNNLKIVRGLERTDKNCLNLRNILDNK